MNTNNDRSSYRFYYIIKSMLKISIVLIMFIFIIYAYIETARMHEYVVDKFSSRVKRIESYLENQFLTSEDILLRISTDIHIKSLVANPDELLSYLNKYKAISNNLPIKFTKMFFLDSNHNEVMNTAALGNHANKHINSKSAEACHNEVSKDLFKMHISPIRDDFYAKELVIPINMSVSDNNGKYIGTICSGLSFKELEKDLQNKFGYQNKRLEVKLLNELSKNSINPSKITLLDIIKWTFTKQKLIMGHKVGSKPIFIELKLEYLSFNANVSIASSFFLIISLLTIFVIYLVLKAIDNYFNKPLLSAHEKLDTITQSLDNEFDTLGKSADYNFNLTKEPLTPEKFTDKIINLTNKINYLFLEKTERKKKEYINEFKKKIYYLALIEHHYSCLDKTTNMSLDKLYLNKLNIMITENYQTMSLDKFLTQVNSYFSTYFDVEIALDFETEETKDKIFNFKYSSLFETIFSIFSFVERACVQEQDTKVSITTLYPNNSNFPTINIKFVVSSGIMAQTTSGWESGAPFAYKGLLNTYLLARENGLYLDIHTSTEKNNEDDDLEIITFSLVHSLWYILKN